MSRLVQVPYNLCFETFANELRVQIIQALMKKSLSVKELAKELIDLKETCPLCRKDIFKVRYAEGFTKTPFGS